MRFSVSWSIPQVLQHSYLFSRWPLISNWHQVKGPRMKKWELSKLTPTTSSPSDKGLSMMTNSLVRQLRRTDCNKPWKMLYQDQSKCQGTIEFYFYILRCSVPSNYRVLSFTCLTNWTFQPQNPTPWWVHFFTNQLIKFGLVKNHEQLLWDFVIFAE